MTGKQTALPDSIEIVKCRSNRNADSIEILNCPLRLCSPSSFSLARSAHPFPSIRFSFFILNIPFLSYKFYPLLIDRYRSYPRSIPLAHSLARMLAQLAPSYLSLAHARRPLRRLSPLAHCRFCNTVLVALIRLLSSPLRTRRLLSLVARYALARPSYLSLALARTTWASRGTDLVLTTSFWRESVLPLTIFVAR